MEEIKEVIEAKDVEYLGVATARYCNVLTVDEKHILFPLNSELCMYSFDTRPPLLTGDVKEDEKLPETEFDGRLEVKQSVTTASLMVLVQSDTTWVGVTYDGDVVVWKKETPQEIVNTGFKEIARINTGFRCCRHASVSLDGTVIALVSEESDDGDLVILSFNSEALTLVQTLSFPNTVIRQCEISAKNQIQVVCSLYETNEVNGVSRKTTHSHSLFTLTTDQSKYDIHEKIAIPDSTYLFHIKTTDDRKYACMIFQSRQIFILDTSECKIIHEDKIEGIGGITCEIIDNFTTSFLVAGHKDSMLKYSINTESNTVSQSDISTSFEFPSSVYNCKLISPDTLVILCESGINAYKLENSSDSTWISKAEFNKNLIHLSGCAVDMNKAGDLVCFGDLSGRLHVYIRKINPTTQKFEFVRDKPFKFQHGVRSIAFHPMNKNVLLVGLMSGWIFYVDPIDDIVLDIGNLHGSVTCIKWYQNFYPGRVEYVFAAGSTSGDVKFWKQEQENMTQFNEIMNLHAHPKSDAPQNLSFGSLNHYSEVWSLVLQNYKVPSDTLKYFSTCSEDQTCKIWKILEEKDEHGGAKCECIDTLQGHTKAVTDVAWYKMHPDVLGEEYKDSQVFASCSDDQKIRLYRVDLTEADPKFTFLTDLNTHFITDWHTITYMAVEENGKRVAVVTQNGYLVIFDITGCTAPDFQQKVLFKQRIHTGSAEGLKWKQGKILTISSDCTMSLICVPQAEESTLKDPSMKGFHLLEHRKI